MDAFSVCNVTTAATSRDMTTLAAVKSELGIDDKDNDEKISRWIRAASGAIETYTKRIFAKETVTETFYRRDGAFSATPWALVSARLDPNAVRLSRFPVTAITSVSEEGVALVAGDYLRDDTNGLLYRLNSSGVPTRWTAGAIAVSYTGGYALLGELPWELEEAAIGLVKQLWFTSGRDPSLRQINVPGVQEEAYWVGSTGDNGAFPPAIAGLLEPFIERHFT